MASLVIPCIIKGTFSKRNFLVEVSVLQHDHGNPICLGHFVFHDTRIHQKSAAAPIKFRRFSDKNICLFWSLLTLRRNMHKAGESKKQNIYFCSRKHAPNAYLATVKIQHCVFVFHYILWWIILSSFVCVASSNLTNRCSTNPIW